MATTTPAYAPDLTTPLEPLPVRVAIAAVYRDYPRIGCRRAKGYCSCELAELSARASNHTRDTGRQYARWHTPLAA